MKPTSPLLKLGVMAVVCLSLGLVSCDKDDNNNGPTIEPLDYYVLTSTSTIIKFNGGRPSSEVTAVGITGMASNEAMMSIDFRPGTGQLYGVSNASKLYIINETTGAATQVGTTAFTPIINGGNVSIDFNPTADRIRLVTDAGQNLRLNPETGAVVGTDNPINGVAGAFITGVAYTNSKAGATSTELYDIDVTTKKLYKQNTPNSGTLQEVGSIGVDFTGPAPLDISYDNKVCIAALSLNGKTAMYTIDLSNGKARKLTDVNHLVRGVAIRTAPVAYATDEANNLIIFNPANPSDRINKTTTGISSGDKVVGMDLRPVNGQLYAMGSNGRLYTVNTSSGEFTQIGGLFPTPLSGTEFGFDFNPTVDRIRVVSNNRQNLRLNPNDGSIAGIDNNINPGTPAITAAAYTNNYPGAASTVLYVIDAAAGKLFRQDANAGTLTEIGALGNTFTGSNGFDIGGRTGDAWALMTNSGTTSLYSINLSTGRAESKGNLGTTVTAFTVGLGQ
jgi:hypothetical protein